MTTNTPRHRQTIRPRALGSLAPRPEGRHIASEYTEHTFVAEVVAYLATPRGKQVAKEHGDEEVKRRIRRVLYYLTPGYDPQQKAR